MSYSTYLSKRINNTQIQEIKKELLVWDDSIECKLWMGLADIYLEAKVNKWNPKIQLSKLLQRDW